MFSLTAAMTLIPNRSYDASDPLNSLYYFISIIHLFLCTTFKYEPTFLSTLPYKCAQVTKLAPMTVPNRSYDASNPLISLHYLISITHLSLCTTFNHEQTSLYINLQHAPSHITNAILWKFLTTSAIF
jgi:hypothetical protein